LEVIGNIYENPKIHPTTHPLILGMLVNRLVWSRWSESNRRPTDYELYNGEVLPFPYDSFYAAYCSVSLPFKR